MTQIQAPALRILPLVCYACLWRQGCAQRFCNGIPRASQPLDRVGVLPCRNISRKRTGAVRGHILLATLPTGLGVHAASSATIFGTVVVTGETCVFSSQKHIKTELPRLPKCGIPIPKSTSEVYFPYNRAHGVWEWEMGGSYFKSLWNFPSIAGSQKYS